MQWIPASQVLLRKFILQPKDLNAYIEKAMQSLILADHYSKYATSFV